MMDFYFNNVAVHNVKLDDDEFNQPIYGPDTSIACYISYERKMIRDSTGVDIVSESTLYTEVNVKEGDLVTFDGAKWIVKTSKPMHMLDGSILFYEVSL
jgi:hypothetical protein